MELLADARNEFRNNDKSRAAQDIHTAAEIMKVQAQGNVKESKLLQTSRNLETVSKNVSRDLVKSLENLDIDLSQAARDEAQHHYLQAAEAWTHHMVLNVGDDLKAGVHATENASDWSGRKISSAGVGALNDTKALSQKLVSGGKWTEGEVGKGIATLGKEIDRLGKDMEPEKKL